MSAADTHLVVDERELVAGTSLWQDAWRRWRRNRVSVVSAVVLVAVMVFCSVGPLAAELLLGATYDGQDISLGASAPSWAHPMGTDVLGRDVMARTMHGGRVSLMVALVATAVSLLVGVTYGAVSGFVGGRVDAAMMRFVDLLLSTPYLLLVIVLMAVIPPSSVSIGGLDGSFVLMFAALGLVSWLVLARIVRGQVLSLKQQEYVEAARAIGVPQATILFRHIVPNTLGPVIVYSTLTIPSVMLSEAFLSFLGLGIREPQASWGTLVSDGANAMVVYPWLLLAPGLTMTLTLFCLNFLGDGLRDALDPRQGET
ncbi:MAG: ABC transporter permease [Alphaproteobacteria bacterium]|nr:ABC transporter permease [Alphaproteobacteria bacterium]